MIRHRITTALVAASMIALPVERATAGSDALGGLAVGAVLGAIAGSQYQKNKQQQQQQQQPKVVYKKPQVSQATRNANAEVQTALNYFGFPAGTPDGVMGRQSRTAVSQYQAFLGYPPSGDLSIYERDFLVTSYHRAIAGGPATMQMVAANPQGTRGLLLDYRNQLAGVTPQAAQPAPAQPMPAMPAPQMVAAPEPVAPAPAMPAPVAVAAPAAAALPSFLGAGSGTPQASLASHCNKVGLQTSSNGGFATLASGTDPSFLLDEQFCLARTYAITQGEDLTSRLGGATPQQVAEQCAGFVPVMRDMINAVSLQPEDKVLGSVADFAVGTGMSANDLATSARVCLSSGYRTDDMDVALGSALVLTALGEKGYGELIGHHLSRGFGTAKRPDLALDWYEDALDAGTTSVFAPGQPERKSMILDAALVLDGRAPAAADKPVPVGLPSFTAPKPATAQP